MTISSSSSDADYETGWGGRTRREKRQLQVAERIGLRVGKVLGKYKVAKNFVLGIANDGFTYHRNDERIRYRRPTACWSSSSG